MATSANNEDKKVLVINSRNDLSEMVEAGSRARTLRDVALGQQIDLQLVRDTPKTEEQAIQILCDIIKKKIANNTYKELRFDAHGKSGIISVGDIKVSIERLLGALEKTQQEIGKPIASTIVFSACNTFEHLTPKQVEAFRKFSKSINAEIIGTTDYVIAVPALAIPGTNAFGIDGYAKDAKYISFKQGEVGYFTEHANHAVYASSMSTIRDVTAFLIKPPQDPLLDRNPDWKACHVGKSQEEGSTCQNTPGKFKVVDAVLADINAPLRNAHKKFQENLRDWWKAP